MDLKVKDVAELLQVSEKTIYRWVKDGRIPCCRINHQYRFSYDEIMKWVGDSYSAENTVFASSDSEVPATVPAPVNLTASINNGGIYYFVEGKTFPKVLENAVSIIRIPKLIPRKDVYEHLIKREKMASTAFGGGIAFPHPREPMIPNPDEESVSVCFLKKPVICAQALDNEPIHTVFIILSSTQERHLKTMSKLAFICRDSTFIGLLKRKALRSEIFSYIEKAGV